MQTIFECRPSIEVDRPTIDFENEVNAQNDWLALSEHLDSISDPSIRSPFINIVVNRPDATAWDCYTVPGTTGLFSEGFLKALGKERLNGFSVVSATLNRVPYYFLRCNRPVACLDRSKSDVETFRSEPNSIKRITRFVFEQANLPKDSAFCIVELPLLLITESVAARIRECELVGVSIHPLP